MKRSSYIFTSLAALALAFLAAANAWLLVSMDGYVLSGEVLTGRRAAAEGIAIRQEASLSAHAVWDAVYYPRGGAGRAEGRWSPESCLPGEAPDPAIYIDYVGAGVSHFGADTEEAMLDYGGVVEAVCRELSTELDGAGTVSRRLRLCDILDCLPIYASTLYVELPDEFKRLGSYDLSGVFPVPVPEDFLVDATLTRNDRFELELERADDGQYDARGGSVFADGSLYFALAIFDEDGAALDASRVPGGSWGVYRIPCPEAEHGSFDADMTSVQLVYAMPEGAEDLGLALSADGERLLLLTAEDGELVLNTMTLAGELIQRLTLADEAALDMEPGELASSVSGVSSYPGETAHVLRVGDTALVLRPDGGGYSVAMSANVSGEALPMPAAREGIWWYYFGYGEQYVSDGERLMKLESGALRDPDDLSFAAAIPYMRLAVYGADGGLAYCEWFEPGLSDVLAYDGVPIAETFALELSGA